MKEKIKDSMVRLSQIWEGIAETIEFFLGFFLKFIGILIIIFLLIYTAPKIIDLLRPKAWTLFLYSSEAPDIIYLLQRIDGYKNQVECLEKGFNISRYKGSYECGYGCRYRNKYGIEICDRVCGQWGCRD